MYKHHSYIRTSIIECWLDPLCPLFRESFKSNDDTIKSLHTIHTLIVLCVGELKGKSMLLFPYCTPGFLLQRLLASQVCCICPSVLYMPKSAIFSL